MVFEHGLLPRETYLMNNHMRLHYICHNRAKRLIETIWRNEPPIEGWGLSASDATAVRNRTGPNPKNTCPGG